MAASGAVTPPTYRVTKALRTRNRNNSNSFARRNAQICTIQLQNRFSAPTLPLPLPPDPNFHRLFFGRKMTGSHTVPPLLRLCCAPCDKYQAKLSQLSDLSADWSDYASVFFFFFIPRFHFLFDLYVSNSIFHFQTEFRFLCRGLAISRGERLTLNCITMGKYCGIISVWSKWLIFE